MNFRKIAFLSSLLITLAVTTPISSQTCKIKTATLDNGNSIYTEVFEYDYVDEKPQFPGGGNSLLSFINSTREYPQDAYNAGIEGRVTCSFVVNENGKISNIKVLRGVETSLNREAVRIMSEMPDWIPGKIARRPVPVRVVCCIPFRK